MKKLISVILLLAVSVFAEAQGIYTSITKMDKFDDVVSKRVVKTLITNTDSTIVIETKGQKPTTYHIIEKYSEHNGSKEKPANLVDDVYGYESSYLAIPHSDYSRLEALVDRLTKNRNDSINESDTENFVNVMTDLMKTGVYITFRTISRYKSTYLFEYATDMVWVRRQDGSRTIYMK